MPHSSCVPATQSVIAASVSGLDTVPRRIAAVGIAGERIALFSIWQRVAFGPLLEPPEPIYK